MKRKVHNIHASYVQFRTSEANRTFCYPPVVGQSELPRTTPESTRPIQNNFKFIISGRVFTAIDEAVFYEFPIYFNLLVVHLQFSNCFIAHRI